MITGRPPKYKTPKEMEKKIDEYFAQGGKTITGLVLHLGFADKQSLYDYQENKPDFTCLIKNARTRVEYEYEKALMDKELKPTGAIFALKNMGWKDKQEVETTQHIENKSVVDFSDRPKPD